MSDYLSNILKYLFWFFCCLAVLMTTLFWYRVDQRSIFQQQASNIIAQDGGINNDTKNKLDKLGYQYHVDFDIDNNNENHVSYGQKIEYKLNMNINWFANVGLHKTQKAYVISTYGA